MYHFTVCIFFQTTRNVSTGYSGSRLINRIESWQHFVILQRAKSEEHAVGILKKKLPFLFSERSTYDALRNHSPSEWINRHGGKFHEGMIVTDHIFEDGHSITSCYKKNLPLSTFR